MKIERLSGFSATNAFNKAKLAYVRLNIQTPSLPRGAVPVNQGRHGKLFHFCSASSLPVMNATAPAIATNYRYAFLKGSEMTIDVIAGGG